ncbi:MAG: hypothetical protein ACI84R_000808, partial [Candidatus Azotimanducaceae bacterium]
RNSMKTNVMNMIRTSHSFNVRKLKRDNRPMI